MLELMRRPTTDQGTIGELRGFDFEYPSIELPWRDNAPRISCIPVGVYLCELDQSPKFGEVYHVRNVPGRDHILLHPANFAGDVSKGFRSDLLGCISFGLSHGVLSGQRAVLQSKAAFKEFYQRMRGQPFKLQVAWSCATPA